MSLDHDVPDTLSEYDRLFGLTPRWRMAAGALVTIGGVALTVVLWEWGFVWGLALFAVPAGLVLLLSGVLAFLRETARHNLMVAVRSREAELVAGMIDAKRKGESPVRWLTSQGIVSGEVRGYLLERVKERERLDDARLPLPDVRPHEPPAVL